jgi:hypothetical protein
MSNSKFTGIQVNDAFKAKSFEVSDSKSISLFFKVSRKVSTVRTFIWNYSNNLRLKI